MWCLPEDTCLGTASRALLARPSIFPPAVGMVPLSAEGPQGSTSSPRGRRRSRRLVRSEGS